LIHGGVGLVCINGMTKWVVEGDRDDNHASFGAARSGSLLGGLDASGFAAECSIEPDFSFSIFFALSWGLAPDPPYAASECAMSSVVGPPEDVCSVFLFEPLSKPWF